MTFPMGRVSTPRLRHRFANADARALAQVKRLARPPVFDQFDARHQTDLPDVADVRQRPERLQFFAQNFFQILRAREWILALQNFQARQRRRRAELVAGETVAVKKVLNSSYSPRNASKTFCVVSVAAIGR